MNNHISKELNIGRAGQYLVLFDLLQRGVNAFPSAEGMNYDLVADIDNRLVKIQVKTTQHTRIHSKNCKNPVYLFHVRRAGKHASRMYQAHEFEGFALVALDIKEVFYMPFEDETKSSILLRDRKINYGRKGGWVRKGIYYQDLTFQKFCDVIRKRYAAIEANKNRAKNV